MFLACSLLLDDVLNLTEAPNDNLFSSQSGRSVKKGGGDGLSAESQLDQHCCSIENCGCLQSQESGKRPTIINPGVGLVTQRIGQTHQVSEVPHW